MINNEYLYSVQYTLYNVHCTLYSVYYTLYTVYIYIYIYIYIVYYTLYNVHYIIIYTQVYRNNSRAVGIDSMREHRVMEYRTGGGRREYHRIG